MNEIDAYIAGYSGEVRERLETLYALIREEAPQTTQRICMSMPTFDLGGKWFVHFAGYDKHIGFYPQPDGIEAFKEQLSGYKTAKGSVQFPNNKPMPYDLIREMIRYKLAAYEKANARTPLEALLEKLSKPAARAIQNEGITELSQLAGYSDAELLSWHGLGKASLPVIRAALEQTDTPQNGA